MKVRYHRGCVDSTMRAARRLAAAASEARYVLATGIGWQIAREPAPFNRRCYRVAPSGEVSILPPESACNTPNPQLP